MIARPVPVPRLELLACTRCAAVVVDDPERASWKAHAAWHANLDELLDSLSLR